MKKSILLSILSFLLIATLDIKSYQPKEGVSVRAKKDSLKKYRSKRHFPATPEPKGNIQKPSSSQPIFVIQEHYARAFHHDFRLEIDGVLASWAVPKQLPKRAGIKRLAVHTEDHPMEYAAFHGTIPKGHYGAGTVTIVDHGTYENIKYHDDKLVPMAQALREGTIEIYLHGTVYSGPYVLVKAHFRESKDNWLIMKKKRSAITKA